MNIAIAVFTEFNEARCTVIKGHTCIKYHIDTRYPSLSFIEVVHDGQVHRLATCVTCDAPNVIVDLMKEYMT